MADSKVSALTTLAGASVAADDELYIVDVSAGVAGSKKILASDLLQAAATVSSANLLVLRATSPNGTTIGGASSDTLNVGGSGATLGDSIADFRKSGFASFTITNATLQWPTGVPDTGLARAAAGQAKVTDGSTGLGGLIVRGDATMPFVLKTADGDAANNLSFQAGSFNTPKIFVAGGVGISFGGNGTLAIDGGVSLGLYDGSLALSQISFCSNQGSFGPIYNSFPNMVLGTSSRTIWTVDKAGNTVLATAFTNATTTLAATNWTWNLIAGRTYKVQGHITVSNTAAAEGFKCSFSSDGVVTATQTRIITQNLGTNVAGTTLATTLGGVINYTTVTGTDDILFSGDIVCGVAGTVTFKAAEDTHTIGTVTIGAGSWINLTDELAV